MIDLKILVALGTIASAQTSGTIETENSVHKLLDYCATHSDVKLRYKARGVVVKAHSGASYFLVSQARSRAGDSSDMGGANYDSNRSNRSIMVILTIICSVISSAEEAEHGALFCNSKEL